jgi:fermentation-respiration switch protein FrsA (DUF1100 family)
MISAGFILLIAIGALWAVTALQKFVTFPRAHHSLQQPDARAAAGGEAIWFDVGGARVEAWFLPSRTAARAPLLVHAHGNGELIDIQVQSVAALRDAGIGVLLVEYPGYGRSTGTPTEKSVTATFLAAYDWATHEARVDPARIIGYGRSLGGGPVAQLAARRPLAAIVLESTFTSIGELVRDKGIPAWLVVNEFDTRAVLEKYPGPVLILHGTKDGTFPVALAHALHKASPRSELHVQDCGHNDCPPQWDLLLSFLDKNGVFSKSVSGGSP